MKKAKMLLLLITLFTAMTLTACGSGGGSSSSSDDGSGAGSNNPSDNGNEGDWMTNFIDTAAIEVLSETDLEFHVKGVFPVGLEADITYTLKPNQTYSPTASELAGTSQVYGAAITYSNVTEDSFSAIDSLEFNLSYFLPSSALPSAVVNLQGLSSLLTSNLSATNDGSQSVVSVVVHGEIHGAGEHTALKMIEHGFGKIGEKIGAGVFGIIGAYEVRQEHLEWEERLKKIEECVKNPLKPSDQQKYQQDPSLKQQALDKIDAIRTEIKQNSGTRFANEMAATASHAHPVGIALWPLVAGGKAYTDDAMKQINDSLLDALEQEMPKCENYYTGWLHPRSTIGDDQDETINSVTLENITWDLSEHMAGDLATYKLSGTGIIEVIKRGSSWEDTCDPVDQYLNGIQFSGVLVVYDANRTDQYKNKYSWAIYPTTVMVNVTANCDNDNNDERVPTSIPVALHTHFSSCGYAMAPKYQPFGTPGDMPEYSSVAILEGSGNWPCEIFKHHAEWQFLEGVQK